MKILILGKNGQVGSELVEYCQNNGIEFLAAGRDALDLTQLQSIPKFFKDMHEFDFVVNATAYTDVDQAEDDQVDADAVNHLAVEEIAKQCKIYHLPLLHISTDYVFDGSKKTMYTENDVTKPLGMYGQTKLRGEQAIQSILDQYLILRVSWVFGKNGKNFVKTMARLAGCKEEIGVVSDQYGAPSSAKHVAEVIMQMISYNLHNPPDWGVFHYTDFPVTTWHQLALASIQETKRQRLPCMVKNILPIESKDYPTPVKRPINSAMNTQKIYAIFGIKQKSWQSALLEVICQYKQECD